MTRPLPMLTALVLAAPARADDGYDLDDVICRSGDQSAIKLDKDLNEVERRAE